MTRDQLASSTSHTPNSTSHSTWFVWGTTAPPASAAAASQPGSLPQWNSIPHLIDLPGQCVQSCRSRGHGGRFNRHHQNAQAPHPIASYHRHSQWWQNYPSRPSLGHLPRSSFAFLATDTHKWAHEYKTCHQATLLCYFSPLTIHHCTRDEGRDKSSFSLLDHISKPQYTKIRH